ncbi:MULTISPECIES: hypothetical protein [unclassified Mammaliicoccus]|uniref:hypothetical protein n=1 Tax=unclassified Mammaliicoccus TaxID=2803851 RepID=UPI001EFC290F|nr:MULTISPECIES: hypothetical protein [unclassified Mammaliicoccus]
MKNFFYTTLIAIGLVFLFYIFFDYRPSGLILLLLGLSIFYLFVIFVKDIFRKKTKEKEREI